MKIVEQLDSIFIIDDEISKSFNGTNKFVYTIPERVYFEVQQIVSLFEPKLKDLLKKSDDGNIPFWEENHHDHLRDFLSEYLQYERRFVSNALSALGY